MSKVLLAVAIAFLFLMLFLPFFAASPDVTPLGKISP
jgi:hypothetical protein